MNFSFAVDPARISGTGIPAKENHSAAALQKFTVIRIVLRYDESEMPAGGIS
jgi:hypothetical protein